MSDYTQKSIIKLKLVIFIVFAELILASYVENEADELELKFFNDLTSGCVDDAMKELPYASMRYCNAAPDHNEVGYCIMKNVRCNSEGKVSSITFYKLALPRIPDSITNLVELKNLVINNCIIIDGINWGIMNKLTNLRALSLPNNKIKGKIQNLNMVNLDKLCLANNNIDEISELKSLNKLTHLDLSNNTIKVDISILDGLKHIRYLDLSHNKFSGNISVIGEMSNLTHLDLSHNDLDGDILSLKNTAQLSYIDLSCNRFSGNISSLIRQETLIYLNLSLNSFSGTLLPLKNIFTIDIIDISNNKFSGEIGPITNGPYGIYTTYTYTQYHNGEKLIEPFEMKALKELNISHNEFSGVFGQFNRLSKLKKLDGSHNRFISTPYSLENLPDLEFVDLSYNMISGNIPRFYRESPFLKHVNLSHNNLTAMSVDDYPSSITHLDVSFNSFISTNISLLKLEYLDLSHNPWKSYIYNSETIKYLNVSGIFIKKCEDRIGGHWWFYDLKSVVILDMSSSNFCGYLDYVFAGRTSPLQVLNVSSNRIRGNIDYLSNLVNLRILDISSNNIRGNFSNFYDLYDLEYLNASNNSISGDTSVFDHLKKLKCLDLSHNKFGGPILDIPRLLALEYLDLSGNLRMYGDCNRLEVTNPKLKKETCNLGILPKYSLLMCVLPEDKCKFTIE